MNVRRDYTKIMRKIVRLTPANGVFFLLLIVVEGLVNALGQGLGIWGTKWLTDLALGDSGVFRLLSVWVVVFSVCASIVLFLLNSIVGIIYVETQGKLRQKIIKNLFSDRLKTNGIQLGDIVCRYAGEVNEAAKLLDGYVRRNALSLCSLVVSFVFGAMLDWRLLIFTLVSGLLIMALCMPLSKPISASANAFYTKQSDLMDKMVKMVQGIAQIRVFLRSASFISDMRALNTDVVKAQGSMKTRHLLVESLMEVIMTLYRVLFIVVGVYMVSRQSLSVSVLLASQQASIMILESIRGIGSLFSLQQGSVTAAQRVLDFMEPPVSACQDDLVPADTDNTIVIDNVSFAWLDGNRVFDRLSFALRPGECVQLAGPNGSGKSTLIRLILGLYRPQEGRIYILNVDTADQTAMERLRKEEVGYVSQMPQFLEGSVRDNIVGFSETVDKERLAYVASVLGIEKYLDNMLCMSLSGDTRESGELSSGEMQLIAIARATYKHPSLLILDEPTSAMDTVSQNGVETLTAELKREGCSVLLVTHRKNVFESIIDRRWELPQGNT
ncbi:MAG: ABC transporter ATP-binding protein [Clostridiales bacterium]|nr:ABC transporter ATP-binding protein [Clostridiales bacterium]